MKNLLIIYGPTGSGKTKISYEIIHQLKKKDLSDRNLKEIIQNIYDHHQWDFQYHDKNWPSSSHIAIINMDSKQIYYDLPDRKSVV